MSRTTFKVLLVVSLLLNVFLIGGVGGGLYQWLNRPKPEVALNQHGLRHALVQLPEAQRRELRQVLRRTRTENQPLILAGRQARLDVLRQLQAPNLDRTSLETDLSKARQADTALRANVDNALADFAVNLPQAERQTLADSMYLRWQGKGQGMGKGGNKQ